MSDESPPERPTSARAPDKCARTGEDETGGEGTGRTGRDGRDGRGQYPAKASVVRLRAFCNAGARSAMRRGGPEMKA